MDPSAAAAQMSRPRAPPQNKKLLLHRRCGDDTGNLTTIRPRRSSYKRRLTDDVVLEQAKAGSNQPHCCLREPRNPTVVDCSAAVIRISLNRLTTPHSCSARAATRTLLAVIRDETDTQHWQLSLGIGASLLVLEPLRTATATARLPAVPCVGQQPAKE